MDNKLPILCNDETCTGCSACINSCSIGAINLIKNEEGFYRPQIDSDKCVGCLKCEKTCPVINPKSHPKSLARVYAAWHKNPEIRSHSTSGGAFSAMAETILGKGGIVVGAAYTENMKVEHICIENTHDLKKLRLSKYVQSRIGTVFQEIKAYLRNGRVVLFCGTPCQVSGLKQYIGENDNLLCCDFICHGVPSPMMYDKYLQWLESKYGKITHINFRDKRKGWYDALRVLRLENGKEKVLKGKQDSFWVGFNNNNNLQLSCYECKFTGFNRVADITIADFWGIGKSLSFGHKDEIEKGVSMLMANNDKGLKLICDSAERMNIFERSKDEMIARNHTIIRSTRKPAERNVFYSDLNNISYDNMVNKHLTPNIKTKLVKFMREYLPFQIIRLIRLKDQK